MLRSAAIWTGLLLLLSLSAYAVPEVKAGLEEGNTGTYSLRGSDYQVTSDFVGSAQAVFVHNGSSSPALSVGQNKSFSNGLNLRLDRILSQEFAGGKRMVEFTLSIPDRCGDGVCGEAEACLADSCCNGALKDFGSDSGNCGSCAIQCVMGQKCVSGSCVTYCGNSICEASESCSSCTYDCGCPSRTKCRNEKCVTYCGNGVCDSDEDFSACPSDCVRPVVCGDFVCMQVEESSCCTDCGCGSGYECVQNSCVQPDKCSSDADCDDADPCTVNRCMGMPKSCVDSANRSCESKAQQDSPIQPAANDSNMTKSRQVNIPSPGRAGSVQTAKKAAFFESLFAWLNSLVRSRD